MNNDFGTNRNQKIIVIDYPDEATINSFEPHST